MTNHKKLQSTLQKLFELLYARRLTKKEIQGIKNAVSEQFVETVQVPFWFMSFFEDLVAGSRLNEKIDFPRKQPDARETLMDFFDLLEEHDIDIKEFAREDDFWTWEMGKLGRTLLIARNDRNYYMLAPINQVLKEYYLEPSYAYLMGAILLVIGSLTITLSIAFGTSPNEALFDFLLMFIHFPEIIVAAIFSVFLISGFLYVKNAKKIIRAKIDHKGFYFKKAYDQSRYESLFNFFRLKTDFTFIPFSKLKKAEYVKGQWLGERIKILSDEGWEDLLGLRPLSSSSKHEIVEVLNREIKKHNSIRS